MKTAQPHRRLHPNSALRSWRAHALLWVTMAVALVGDLWTKEWAFRVLGPDDARPVAGGILVFHRSLNDGALFGLGKGLVPVFILASLLAVGFILYLFTCSQRNQKFLHVALGLILAGAMGNLYDRTFMQADRLIVKAAGDRPELHVLGRLVGDVTAEELKIGVWPEGARPRTYRRADLVEEPRTVGVVRDFIKISPIRGREIWPWVFNVADALLVVGVGMLLIGLAFERRAPAPATESASAGAAVS